MSELTDWIMVISAIALFVATFILAWYTRILGRYANTLNEMEAKRDEERKREKLAMERDYFLKLMNEMLDMRSISLAYTISLEALDKPISGEMTLLEDLKKLIFLIDDQPERNFIEKLIDTLLSYCDSARMGSRAIPTQEAIAKQIDQLQEHLSRQIGALREKCKGKIQ